MVCSGPRPKFAALSETKHFKDGLASQAPPSSAQCQRWRGDSPFEGAMDSRREALGGVWSPPIQ